MARFLILLYGATAYAIFFVSFLYAIGFVTGLIVPKTIDSGAPASLSESLIVNLLLLAVRRPVHSVMARPAFKAWWTQYVPKSVERSTYVLLASLALDLLVLAMAADADVVWHRRLAAARPGDHRALVRGLAAGAAVDLPDQPLRAVRPQQVFYASRGREAAAPRFRTPILYKPVRHPIYLGFLIAFWVTPTMTVGHLLFAAATTAYILIGIALEEHDLVELFGDDYRDYRKRVSMLLPWRKSA